MQQKKIHYAWIIVLSGVFTLFSCLGLGRFALGMLLPSMGEDLTLTYTQMGLISTGNFIGYLVAVLICGIFIRRLGERWSITSGLIMVGLSMLLVSQSANFMLITALYFVTGIGSGIANITAMSLVAHWFAPKYRGRAAGYMIVGNGLGIVTSGILIPWLNTHWLEDGWRIGWGAFGIAIIIAAIATALLIRNNPKQLGLQPFGSDESIDTDSRKKIAAVPKNKNKLITHIGSIYFLFGFTYVIYATFIVTTLVEQYHFSEDKAGILWMAIGVLSIFSGALFGGVSDRFGRKAGLMAVFAIQTLSYGLAASEFGQVSLFLSMVLFGISAFSIPAIIAATVSDMLPPAEAGKVFGFVTFFFGIGQIAGPTIAGFLAEQTDSFTSSYLLAAIATALAVVLSFILKPIKQSH